MTNETSHGVVLYVMTVGFSLPVNSFSFDTDNAKSKA